MTNDNLIDDFTFDCVLLDKVSIPDGSGGFDIKWVEGADFQAAITYDSSMQARIAEAQGVKSIYTITTARNVNLQYHDVLKRSTDDKIFRVTSDGDDNKSPESGTLNMRQVSAEEWSLPND